MLLPREHFIPPCGRQSLIDVNLWWTTSLMEDILLMEGNQNESQLLMEDIVWWNTTLMKDYFTVFSFLDKHTHFSIWKQQFCMSIPNIVNLWQWYCKRGSILSSLIPPKVSFYAGWHNTFRELIPPSFAGL